LIKFRLPTRCRRDLRSFGILRSVELDLLTLEDGTNRLSRNVGKELLLYAA